MFHFLISVMPTWLVWVLFWAVNFALLVFMDICEDKIIDPDVKNKSLFQVLRVTTFVVVIAFDVLYIYDLFRRGG